MADVRPSSWAEDAPIAADGSLNDLLDEIVSELLWAAYTAAGAKPSNNPTRELSQALDSCQAATTKIVTLRQRLAGDRP